MTDTTSSLGERRQILDLSLSRRGFLARTGQVGLGVAALGSFGSLLAACSSDTNSGSGSGPVTLKKGGTLLAGVPTDPDSLDPQKSSLATAAEIYAGIFSRLVDLQSGGKVAPSLATSWTTPDDKTYVFDLRQGVTFHNGDPLTPEDVVFTFDRMISKSFGSTYASDFAAVSGIEKTGPNQVTFHLRQPFAPFLANLANRGHVLSEKAVKAGDPRRNPVGTGPFKFDGWTQGQTVKLARNPHYFLANHPHLDGVEFRYRPIDQSRVLALQSGQLQWADGLPPQSISSAKSTSGLKVLSSSETGKPEFLFFNLKSGPLKNKALRQAIAWGIDRKEIAKAGFFGTVEPGSQEFGSSSAWFDKDSDPYSTGPNPDMVRSKLAEAGFPNGGVTIRILAETSRPDAPRTAQLIQQQLKPYGIKIEIETVEVSVWVNRLFAGEFEITQAFQEQLVDPDNYWTLFWTTNASQNVTGYSNPAFDELVTQAANTVEVGPRKEIYARARKTILEDAALFFTIYMPLNYAYRSDVGGVGINAIQDPQFVNVGLT
jgi:peptide/nickel transport system substrate-binding protein